MQNLSIALKVAAGENVRHHLTKLVKDGRVVKTEHLFANTFRLNNTAAPHL